MAAIPRASRKVYRDLIRFAGDQTSPEMGRGSAERNKPRTPAELPILQTRPGKTHENPGQDVRTLARNPGTGQGKILNQSVRAIGLSL